MQPQLSTSSGVSSAHAKHCCTALPDGHSTTPADISQSLSRHILRHALNVRDPNTSCALVDSCRASVRSTWRWLVMWSNSMSCTSITARVYDLQRSGRAPLGLQWKSVASRVYAPGIPSASYSAISPLNAFETEIVTCTRRQRECHAQNRQLRAELQNWNSHCRPNG